MEMNHPSCFIFFGSAAGGNLFFFVFLLGLDSWTYYFFF
jgi:hypothetical protein